MVLMRFHALVNRAKGIVRHPYSTSSSSSSSSRLGQHVPKGHLAIYVGENIKKNRFIVPITYLNHPMFQDLLKSSEEEYGFHYPMGGLTIPCSEILFRNVTTYLDLEFRQTKEKM